MRKLLRILFIVTIGALIAVLLTLALGDRLYTRTSPAVRLVYDIQSPGGAAIPPVDMAAALKQRIDPGDIHELTFRGLTEPPRIEITAPATVPRGELKRILQMGGILSFHVVVEDPGESGVPEMLARMQSGGAGPKPQPGDTLRWLPYANGGDVPLKANFNGVNYLLVHATPDKSMSHEDPAQRWSVTSARPTADQGGGAAVAFELDKSGARLFGDLTGNNTGRLLAIVLDGSVLSAPRVNSRIEGHGIITGLAGGFSPDEIQRLIGLLNAGALPAKLSNEPVSEDYLTVTLGMQPLARFSLKAATVALAVIAAMLSCALLLLRRLRPTVRDQEAALESMGFFDQP